MTGDALLWSPRDRFLRPQGYVVTQLLAAPSGHAQEVMDGDDGDLCV